MKQFPVIVLGLVLSSQASAEAPLQQGRSVGVCSDSLLVCAISKDGREQPTDECQAKRENAARILQGDCWDED